MGLTATLLALAAATAAADPTPAPRAAAADRPLLARAAAGTRASTGLDAAMSAGALPAWPVQLTPLETARPNCAGENCTQWQRLDLALGRAAAWMAEFPTGDLRFGAATMLAATRETIDSEALRLAFERARAVADRDDDNPRRRFWVPDLRVDPSRTSRWTVPTDGKRVNTNRVVEEALYCGESGWREETMRYVCGPMRDDGGYYSTHALWGLSIAHGNGCIESTASEPCVRSIQSELAAKQPRRFAPKITLDIDLYAERLLTLVQTGYPDPVVDQWALTLLDLQTHDGSWGVSETGEPPYYRYHATAVSTWALAEWIRRVVAQRS